MNGIVRLAYVNGKPVVPHRYLQQPRLQLCERQRIRAERRWPAGVPLEGAALVNSGVDIDYAFSRCLSLNDLGAVSRHALRALLLGAERVAVHAGGKAARPFVAQAQAIAIEVVPWPTLRARLKPLSEACPSGRAGDRLEAALIAVEVAATGQPRPGLYAALQWLRRYEPEAVVATYEFACQRFIAREAQDRAQAARRQARREGAA